MTTKTLGQVVFEGLGNTHPWSEVAPGLREHFERAAKEVAEEVRPVVLDECATQIRTLTEELARVSKERDEAKAQAAMWEDRATSTSMALKMERETPNLDPRVTALIEELAFQPPEAPILVAFLGRAVKKAGGK